MITQTINLNLIPGGVLPRINVSQYDKGARTLQFNLYNGVIPFTIPDGSSVYVVGTKADRTGFDYEATYTGGLVSIDVTEQMTAFAGDVEIEIRIIKSGEQIATGNFVLCVERTALADDTVISETDIPIIQHLPELVAETEENAELAHKWATFGDESEEPSATNNAKYWAEQAAQTDIGQFEERYENDIYGVNLFKVTATTSTIGGVTYTVNSDLSVFTSGLTPSGSTSQLELGSVTLAAGTYRGSGCASGGSYSPWTYQMHFRKNNASGELIARDTGDGCVFTLSETTVVNVKITVNESIDMSGKKFYPMIYDASLGSNLPYCKFNEQSIQNQLNNITGELNVRNKLNITATTTTINGMTFTVGDKKKITLNGTTTANATFSLVDLGALDGLRGSYKGVINENAGEDIWVSFLMSDGTYKDIHGDSSEIELNLTDSLYARRCHIYVKSGVTLSNRLLTVMISSASDPDPTYVPYAMTNRELTEKVFEKGTLTSSDDLNNITDTGIYHIATAPTNCPTAYATLIVSKRDSTDIQQLIVKAGGRMYTRVRGGNPADWESWYLFTGTVVS